MPPIVEQGPPEERTAGGTTYYVDSVNGDDSNPGTQSSPWKSLAKVNLSIASGDTVLFRRGTVTRGNIDVRSGKSGDWTYYGAYGTGDRPVILGSVDLGSAAFWVLDGGNIWRTSSAVNVDIGALFFNGVESFGTKKWFAADLSAQGDFFYNPANGYLYLYSTSNPGSYYTALEAAQTRHVVDFSNSGYALFENLHLKFGSAHGFGGGNTEYIIVRDCEMSYLGGGHLDGEGYASRRYGNGLEFWGNASNHLVEQCLIYEIYDTGLTNQSAGAITSQFNIFYRNNIIYNCGLSSFEIWNRPDMSRTVNVHFINNTCYNAGSGWGRRGDNRSDGNVFQVALFDHQAQTSGVYIENNIFFSDTSLPGLEYQLLFYDPNSRKQSRNMSIDYNLWYQPGDNPVAFENTLQSFGAYSNLTGHDTHSVFQDPLFTDASLHDFSLQASSPAVNTGTTQDYRTTDYLGSAMTGLPDIGAIEF